MGSAKSAPTIPLDADLDGDEVETPPVKSSKGKSAETSVRSPPPPPPLSAALDIDTVDIPSSSAATSHKRQERSITASVDLSPGRSKRQRVEGSAGGSDSDTSSVPSPSLAPPVRSPSSLLSFRDYRLHLFASLLQQIRPPDVPRFTDPSQPLFTPTPSSYPEQEGPGRLPPFAVLSRSCFLIQMFNCFSHRRFTLGSLQPPCPSLLLSLQLVCIRRIVGLRSYL